LYIPVARLILLSIASFSAYEAYWVYKNWRYVKERDNLDIRPFWRGWFGVFFCHALLHRIHDDQEARSVELPSFSPGGLASTWVVLVIFSNVLSRAPGVAASIIAAFIPSFLCLVPVQRYVNSVNERRIPGKSYYRWSSGHIVCLVFGIIVWALLLTGLAAE
jgi:amino acid permease